MDQTNTPQNPPSNSANANSTGNGGGGKSRSSSSAGMFRRSAHLLWRHKKKTLFVVGIAYWYASKQLEKARESARNTIIDGTVLTWRINSGSIVECREPMGINSGSLLGILLKALTGGRREITMLQALAALERAADDPRIKSLIVSVAPEISNGKGGRQSISTGLGMAQVQELRQALETFRRKKDEQLGEGKGRTYFYIDSFMDQPTYYLASAFTDIIAEPTGDVPLTGLSMDRLYFKRLGDKVGLKAHVEARKEYKGIVGPFSESSMPEKHRENAMSILVSLTDMLVNDIALTRGSDLLRQAAGVKDMDATSATSASDLVRQAMAVAPLSVPDAVNAGLVTKAGYSFDIESIIGPRKPLGFATYSKMRGEELAREKHKAQSAKAASSASPPPSSLTSTTAPASSSLLSAFGIDSPLNQNEKSAANSFKKALMLQDPTRPIGVGVVYLVGTINRLGAQGSHAVSSALMQAARDPTISAIVLRIDSGGGDVVASDTIAAAVDYVQTEFGKPVVASYGNASASGAYYASASCKRIFASPGTITGSIGVAAIRPVVTEKLLDFVGVNVEELHAIDGNWLSLFHEPEGEPLERYRRNIDRIYSDFTARVAKGRGYTDEQVEAVARGQVFTGIQALENGLVDELGGFTRAIEAAAQMGHEARLDIMKKLASYHYRRSIIHNLHDGIAAKKLASVEAGQEMVADATTLGTILVDSIANASKASAEEEKSSSDSTLADQTRAGKDGGKDAKEFVYKADIHKNIHVKTFPDQSSPAGSLAEKIANAVIGGRNDDSATVASGGRRSDSGGGVQMLVRDMISQAISTAIRREAANLLASDASDIASVLAESQGSGQIRAESRDVRFK
ncbi:hypothetical protein GGI07_001972 [Coemansia sp. Benny D115]|nr:hypothetical protein GGI07_001972 [Coemansia sp. Benny D115]